MSKASQLLDELKNLDTDIQSRIDEVRTLEAGLLSSPKWSTDKVKGGKPTKVDDVYAQLIVLKESTPSEVRKDLFDRLNTSSLRANSSEVRAGRESDNPLMRLIKELKNDTDFFKKILTFQ